MFSDEYVELSAHGNLAIVKTLNLQISKLEKVIFQKGGLKPEFKVLSTVPGIGDIIALSISLEIGEIKRFEKPSSVCFFQPMNSIFATIEILKLVFSILLILSNSQEKVTD